MLLLFIGVKPARAKYLTMEPDPNRSRGWL